MGHSQYNMSTDKKQTIRIKQFEWYEVETRVREIMGELLQPFNKKQTEQTIKMNEIKRNIAAITKKLQDHDFLLDRQNAQKPTYIQLQDKRIDECVSYANSSQLDNQGRLKKMQAIIAIYEQKIKQLNDLERRLDSQIIQRSQQFRKYKQGVDVEVQLLIKKQDTQIEQITQFKHTTKSAVSKMQTRMIHFDNRLKELQDDMRHRSSDLKKLIEEASLHNEKIIKLEIKMSDISIRIDDREKDTKLSQKFFSKVKEVEIDLQFIQTFLEQYQPLYIQMQISQTLNSFIDGKHRRKLCVFEQQKFARLHHHILLNQKISLQEMMSSFTGNIRKIINRNKKYVINLSVSESVKYGGNIYQFRIDNIRDQVQEEAANSKPASYIVPEEEIMKVVSEKMDLLSEEVRKMAEKQIAPTKTWMKELQEQMLMRSLQYDGKYQQLKKKVYEGEAREQLQQKHLEQELSRLLSQQAQFQANISNFREHVKDILNFSSVINHIVIQDEIDRQGTALYALRSKNSPQISQMPTLQLDPNCVNCQNKNSSIIQQAFKMACLTYNPSQIRIDEQLFSREQILQISTSILEKLKKKLWINEGNRFIVSQKQIGKRTMANVGTINNNTINVSGGQNRRKSSSTLKQATLTSRQNYRTRQLQTLLPILGATRADRKERKAQLSVFY